MKKIIIIIVFCLALTPKIALSQADQPPIQPGPDERRPDDCQDQCATISSDGYTFHLWYKAGRSDGKTDEVFTYAAIVDGSILVGTKKYYIFRSNSRNDFFVAINLESTGLKIEKHFTINDNKKWDQTPTGDQFYSFSQKLLKSSTKISMPSGVDDNNIRYSWRVVAQGKVTFNNGTTTEPAKKAGIKLKIDQKMGPPFYYKETSNDGVFEFSRKGLTGDEELWLNQKNVNKTYFYVRYEKDGKKYETYLDKNFTADFNAPHENDKVKFIDNLNIELTDKNQVSEFSEDTGIIQNIVEEVGNLWENQVIAKLVCWLRNGVLKFFYFEANLAGYFLRRNY